MGHRQKCPGSNSRSATSTSGVLSSVGFFRRLNLHRDMVNLFLVCGSPMLFPEVPGIMTLALTELQMLLVT